MFFWVALIKLEKTIEILLVWRGYSQDYLLRQEEKLSIDFALQGWLLLSMRVGQ